MNEIISKELLNEVLRLGGTLQMRPIREDNMIGYLVYGSQNTVAEVHNNHKRINIYELAYKCKEWAYTKNIILSTQKSRVTGLWCCDLFLPDNNTIYPSISNDFDSKTEPEAVFKATSYIMEQLKQNKKDIKK